MKLQKTEIKDCVVVKMDRHEDHRGFFQEFYQHDKYGMIPSEDGFAIHSLQKEWKQMNWSHSQKNVLRGIHVAPYAKLVTCVSGAIYDVAVDVRKDSPSFGNWYGKWLRSEDPEQMLIPAGCGHGFMAVTGQTSVIYLQDAAFTPGIEKSINCFDLGIDWPMANPDYILSEEDDAAQSFNEYLAAEVTTTPPETPLPGR
jgi:dTDP-4-dehydrorhamnose 3,5-epimerase